MAWELRKDWEPDNRDLGAEYYKGYNTGYDWLNPDRNPRNGYNFLHPSEPKGYIPGGPLYFPKYERWSGKKDDFPHRASTYWHRGFIEGINDYVRENGLDYPELQHSRW